MTSSDNLQIRLGITVDGVQAAQDKTRAAEQGAKVAQRVADSAHDKAKMAEKISKKVEHDLAKFGAKAALGLGLEHGLEALLPNADHNMLNLFKSMGIRFGTQALMNPTPAGVAMGLIHAGMTVLEKGFEWLKERVTKNEEDWKKADEMLGKILDARRNDEVKDKADMEKLKRDVEKSVKEAFKTMATLRAGA